MALLDVLDFDKIGFGLVEAGVWTQIYSGPTVHPYPLMLFNFKSVPPTVSVSFFRIVDIVNVGFGTHQYMGTSTANPMNDLTQPELAVADPASIWTVVRILTDTTIKAKCW
jgi:hypothetical protein